MNTLISQLLRRVLYVRRTIFSGEQLQKLEELFDKTHYPDTSQREALSAETHLSDDRIQVSSLNTGKLNHTCVPCALSFTADGWLCGTVV